MAKKKAKTTPKSNPNSGRKSWSGAKPRQMAGTRGDVAYAVTIERLEAIAGGADEDDPRLFLDPGHQGTRD